MFIIKSTILIVCLLAAKTSEPAKPYVSSYVETYKYMAIDEMVRSGIPASIILAQAILESNAGVSQLARQSNNHFGIKCKDYWEGSTYYHPDDDRDAKGNLIPSCFRKYDSVRDSYEDHSVFLMNTQQYQALFAYDKTDYILWAEGLEACGYATDDAYAEKLLHTIDLYDLHELDYYTVQFVTQSKTNSEKGN